MIEYLRNAGPAPLLSGQGQHHGEERVNFGHPRRRKIADGLENTYAG
jgi:hypothetical protein